MSEGPELVIRSSRSIAKNEEITLSYIDSTQSFEERQNALSTQYAFGCQCPKCEIESGEQEVNLANDPGSHQSILFARSELHALLVIVMNGYQELEGVETKMRQICNQSGKPWTIEVSPLPKLYEVLAQRYELKHQWKKALYYRLKLVYIINPSRYPEQINIHRVEQLMALSQLEGCVLSPSPLMKMN